VPVLILVLLVAFGLFLAADGQHAIGERYIEILLIDAWQLIASLLSAMSIFGDSVSELNRANGVRWEKSSNVF
jgi:hypothetical protein